jgi:hypothetical protein
MDINRSRFPFCESWVMCLDIILHNIHKYVIIHLMSMPGEGVSPQADPTARTVTVRLSMIEGLIQRVEALEGEARQLRELLGELALCGESADSDCPQALGKLPEEAAPIIPAGSPPIRLYSRLDVALQTPFSKIEAPISARNELVDAIRDRTADYGAAFRYQMFSRLSSVNTNKTLPPCPSYEQSPKEYDKYIKKYGRTIKWAETEEDELKAHKFSLTYLPGQLAPDLVRFTIDSEEKETTSKGRVDVNLIALSLHMNHKFLMTNNSWDAPSVRDERELNITLGSQPSISVHRPRVTWHSKAIYAYDPAQRSFIDTNINPDVREPPISHSGCVERVDTILARVPTLPGENLA